MTDLTIAAIMVAVLCIGWCWIAGPEPPTSTKGWHDGIDSSCEWGTCDCFKCGEEEEKD